jgi:hypothetical protein
MDTLGPTVNYNEAGGGGGGAGAAGGNASNTPTVLQLEMVEQD